MSQSRYVALLRGINVGKAKRVSMADLRAAVESLGYRDVRTLLNSGNVVFSGSDEDVDRVARSIEATIESEFGFTSRVVVLTAEELAAIVRENPIVDRCADPSRFLVAVFRSPVETSSVQHLLTQDWEPSALALVGRAAYLWCADGILDSPLSVAFGKAAGDRATARNWTTMLKLNALASG